MEAVFGVMASPRRVSQDPAGAIPTGITPGGGPGQFFSRPDGPENPILKRHQASSPTNRIPGRPVPAPGAAALWVVLAVLAAGLLAPSPAAADEELEYGLEAHRLAQIRITGNETFSEGDLKRLLRIQESTWSRPLHIARYQPHMVQAQVRLLEVYYRNRGFHQVAARLDSITTIEGEGDVLHFSIDEGPRTFIRSVSFRGNGPIPEEKLREVLTLVEGQPAPADLNAFGGDIYALLALYRNETYLDATVVPSMTLGRGEAGEPVADVTYTIRPGTAYRVRDIRLAGNTSTRDGLLERELLIAPGEPLRWQKVEDSRRQLLATSLFRDVTITTVDVDSVGGETDLLVRVIERKPAFYEIGVGIGSLERIRALAAWGHYNLWGTGRRIQVRARAGWNMEDVVGRPISFDKGQLNYRGDIQYVNPHVRGSRYSFDAEFYVKRETRGESGINLLTTGLNLGTTWRSSRYVTNQAFFGFKVTSPDVHPWAPDSLKVRFDDLGATTDQTRSLNFVTYIDHRDDRFRPTAGVYTVGTAKLAGGIMGGDFSFFKWSGALHHYRGTPLGGTVAFRIQVGGTRPYGSSLALGPDGVPYDDRFFAGGASTVRGYRQNSLGPQVADEDERDRLGFSSDVLLPDNPARGGNYLMLTNAEWRFPLPLLRRWKLSSVFFFEGGNVWEKVADIRMRGFRLRSEPGLPDDPASTKVWDYRWSMGTGVRLDTPFGPVRVDLGIPLKRARFVSDTTDYSDPKVVWHFSLGYPF